MTMPVDLNLTDVRGSRMTMPVATSGTETERGTVSSWPDQIRNLLPSDTESESGLQELVEENAVLGLVLQTLADDSDLEAEVTPVAADVSAPASRGGSGTVADVAEAPQEVQYSTRPASERWTVSASRDGAGAVAGEVSAPASRDDSGTMVADVSAPVSRGGSDTVEEEVSAPASRDGAGTVVADVSAPASRGGSDAVAATPSAMMVEAAGAVADAILVTPGLMRGQGEIRVQLKADVLGGTEVRVAVTGRQMEVTFVPPTHEVAVLIAQNQSVLTAHLAERIRTFDVSVGVRRRGTEGEERA